MRSSLAVTDRRGAHGFLQKEETHMDVNVQTRVV